MAPDVDFILTEEGFKACVELLAAQGVKVLPKFRHTTENLVDGRLAHEEISGTLEYRRFEYNYSIFHDDKDYYRLTVDVFADRAANRENLDLLAAIKRAFPQPAADRGHIAPHELRRGPDKGRILITAGCVGCLIFVFAIVFFAVVGVRSFFLK